MTNRQSEPEKVMNLKESSHLLADVLNDEGIDIYKRSLEELKKLHPAIVNTRLRIDAVLKEYFQTSFHDLDNLSPEELHKIRESFLQYYRGSIEKAEKLKKWVPLSQMVGYTEVLVASAYMQLNTEIDEDLEKNKPEDIYSSLPAEYLRMKILNAMKKFNQGKDWVEIKAEIICYLEESGISGTEDLAEKWRISFEGINHPLQQLYAGHADFMQINESIRDLQYREQKRSAVIGNLVGTARRRWKPEDLEHDIHAQSAEVNRSIIELICNGIDANDSGENRVDVSINGTGYSVRDHGSGMNPFVILEKLMVPKVSGKTGKDTIGRFGVGFYTVLSHLKNKNDLVRVETHDGKTGHIIEFKIHERTGDIFVHTERNDDLERGTEITVRTENFDNKDAESLCRRLLGYNDRSGIMMNGKRMNTMDGLKKLKGWETAINYSTEISDSSKVSLLVNGVVIENMDVRGTNVCRELALDFPLTCSLPESRSELSVDAAAIGSIKEMIETVLSAPLDENEKIAVCNALYPMLEKLQARTRGNKKEDNLPLCMRERFKDMIETKGRVFLPNTKAFQSLKIEDAVFIDSGIFTVDLEKIPGITVCENFESTQGYHLYIADFKEDSGDFVVEDGNRLVIDRRVYELHNKTPAALNVFFSNLDHTGLNNKEKKKGEIITRRINADNVPEKPEKTKELDEEFKRNMFLFEYPTVMCETFDAKDHIRYALLDEREQVEVIKDKIIDDLDFYLAEALEAHDRRHKWEIDHGKIPVSVEEKMEAMNRLKEMVIRCRSLDELDMLDKPINDSIFTKAHQCKEIELCRWIKFMREIGPDNLAKPFKKAQEYEVNGLTEWYLSPYITGLSFLHEIFPFQDLNKFFSEYDGKYLVAYLDFMFCFTPTERKNPFGKGEGLPEIGITKEAIIRADELFRKKLMNKSADEIFAISAEIEEVKQKNRNRYFNKIQFHNVPRSCRGFLMYILEGGEILDEKDSEKGVIEQEGYQAQIPLSTLVQAKKDNESFFQEFGGTPAELVAGARESQKGIDPSKALRDIMHSAENQIVNDGYLWIREVLQNSLDAVKKNREKFEDAPRIKIDAFLLNGEEDDEDALVVEASDPVGMDLHTIINYLLIPNESSKKYDEETVGKFGQGFFTIFGDAREVLIKTSKDGLHTEYVRIRPIKDDNWKIIDFSVEFSRKFEKFKGTVIQKVVDTDMPEVEAAFCKSAVISYGGLIDRKTVQLDFRDKEVNKSRTLLAETEIPGLGPMRLYDANENAVTQNGLYIKGLDEELMAGIPEYLKKIIQKNGIVLDIPPGIKLIKSRADIAGKKEIIPLLARHMPALALRAYLASVMLGNADLNNVPYDYFEEDRRSRVPKKIINDAQKLLQGVPLDNYETYLQNEDALFLLLTVLPCIKTADGNISISDLAGKISQDPKSVDLSPLPESIKKHIKYAVDRKSLKADDQERAAREYGSSDTIIMGDRGLPEGGDIGEQASAYYAYDQLVRNILGHLKAAAVQPGYYLEIGESLAHARIGTDSIGFNLYYLEKQLPLLSEIIEKKLPATDEKVQEFLAEAIALITHERQHNLEGSEETTLTHNDVFFDGQRKILTGLIKDHSVDFQKMLDDLYGKFKPPVTLMTAKEFIKYM